jgi:hypothetical protein
MSRWPKTVDEAVDQLLLSMSEEDKGTLRNTPEGELFFYHFGWGLYIRNKFGLWSGNEEILKSCVSRKYPDSAYDEFLAMMMEPDGASMEIIKATWQRLRQE